MNNTFGNVLQDLLNEKRIPQAVLAEETGITRASISRYVNGKRFPSSESIIKIANFFDIDENLLYAALEKDSRKIRYSISTYYKNK